VELLRSQLEDLDEIEAFVSGRAKEVRSVEQKLRARDRAEPGRDAGYQDLPDLVGVRVVVRLEHEIAIVAAELHRLLVVDKDVDVRDERGRDETPGYRGRHFDVRARAGAELPELLRTQPAEVQVRTRAADVWASIEHDLRYKGAAPLPPERSRQFVLAASLLELAERELEDLRAWHLATQAEAVTDRQAGAPAGPAAAMDVTALAELLAERYPGTPSTPRRLGWMLDVLREMHIERAEDLLSRLPAVPDPRVLALVEGRASVDNVRMLDDELLLVMPDAYLRANRVVPDERNPHRIRTLQRRQRRLAGG
jgi:putative GTP pyrophosphokinase